MIEFDLEGRPKELIQAEQLVVEGKFEEAYQLMDKFKERGDYSPRDAIICNLLKIAIMIQQGLYEDAAKLAKQTYNESLELQDNILTFDVLNLETQTLLHLYKVDAALEKIKEEEEILKILPQKLTREYKKRKAALEFLKSWYYLDKNDPGNIKKHYDLCLPLLEEIGDNRELAYVLLASTMYFAGLLGDLDKAIKNIEKGFEILKTNKWKYGTAFGLLTKGIVYSLKGDIKHSIIYYNQSLTLFKELNNNIWVAHILNNLAGISKNIGDLERALEYIESSIKYANEAGIKRDLAAYYDYLIQILIEKGDLEQAEEALKQLEYIKNQLNDKQINLYYQFNKALVLKTSSRSRNRIEAEDILKQIIEDETIQYELIVVSLLNLCELLLIELSISNDLTVLEEIKTYTARLLEIAEKSHSFILFAEIYFLKAKLGLLTLDLKNARRFLTQAQRIAERWGYNQLATQISQENDKLNNQLSMWDELREEEISLEERIKLAGLDKQMEYLLQNRAKLTTQVNEEQITVHKERKTCIVCKGYISGYMYGCVCGALYCGKCAQAITEIENTCWVCNAPIDITKPIKSYEREEIGKKENIEKPNKKSKDDNLSAKK